MGSLAQGSTRLQAGRIRIPTRILILRPGALGDTILALPAIRAIRKSAGPAARVELVGYPLTLRLALNSLHADAAHSIDRLLFAGLFSEPVSEELEAFISGYPLVVAWCRDPTGHLTRVLEGSGVGFLRADPYPEEGSRVHATDHLARTLLPLGIERPAGLPELVLPGEALAESERFLRDSGLEPGRFLALHPGSGTPAKNWPVERFAGLAEQGKKAGLGILIIAGEADRSVARGLREALSSPAPVAREMNLLVLGSILSRASAYAGNDSGVTHLAASSGVPTLALFGPTDPALWAPRGRHVKIVELKADAGKAWKELKVLAGL